MLGKTPPLLASGSEYSLPNNGGRLARLVAGQFVEFHPGHRQVDVDTIENWSGETFLVPGNHRFRTGARPRQIAIETTRTLISCGDEREFSRKCESFACACDGHDSILNWLKSVLDRFTQVCQADPRVVAAFVCGSLARGAADEHSDVDLGLITTDRSSDEFLEGYSKFINVLGEPIFLELFGPSQTIFCILGDGMEVEISIGRESNFVHMAYGPFQVLVDKQWLLAGVTLPGRAPDPAEQRAHLRRQLTWFWHDLSHFLTAMSRGQLWWPRHWSAYPG